MFNHQQWSLDVYPNINSSRDHIYITTNDEATIELSQDYSVKGNTSCLIERELSSTPTKYSFVDFIDYDVSEGWIGKTVTFKGDILALNCAANLTLFFYKNDSTNEYASANIPQNTAFTSSEVSKELISDVASIRCRVQITSSQNNCKCFMDNLQLTIS